MCLLVVVELCLHNGTNKCNYQNVIEKFYSLCYKVRSIFAHIPLNIYLRLGQPFYSTSDSSLLPISNHQNWSFTSSFYILTWKRSRRGQMSLKCYHAKRKYLIKTNEFHGHKSPTIMPSNSPKNENLQIVKVYKLFVIFIRYCPYYLWSHRSIIICPILRWHPH